MCCIGTTIKKAKSQKNFKYVDYEIPLKVAEIAYTQGVQSFSLVSSIGANVKASSFYLRVKGLVEKDLKNIGFNRC